MGDKITINLVGNENVIAALKELKDDLPKDPLRKAVREAAKLLTQFVVLAAPKFTGRLARNIAVRIHKTAKTIRGRVTVNTGGGRNSPDDAFYWRFLEKGWQTRDGKTHKFPFIAPVFEAKNREAAQTVIDACEKQVAKARAKIARAAGSK